MTIETARAAVELLEKVARNEIPAAQALSEWPQTQNDPLLDASWHDLSHFDVDDDIRAKDAAYARLQSQLLLDRAEAIRTKFKL